MRFRLPLFVITIVAACSFAVTVGAAPGFACDTSFWNIGCQSYSPSEGHTASQFGPGIGEYVYSTFDTWSTVLVISTLAGGTWKGSFTIGYGQTGFFFDGHDKDGCYNHHTSSMFVNCRHYDG